MFEALREEIQYRLEILGDDCLYYLDRMRKPLMLGAFISVLLTFKSGRESSDYMKHKLSNFSGLGLFGSKTQSMGYSGFKGGSYGASFGSSYGGSQMGNFVSSSKTASLMDAYPNVKAIRGGQFHDYGSTKMFAGEMVTLKSIEASAPVDNALSAQGAFYLC